MRTKKWREVGIAAGTVALLFMALAPVLAHRALTEKEMRGIEGGPYCGCQRGSCDWQSGPPYGCKCGQPGHDCGCGGDNCPCGCNCSFPNRTFTCATSVQYGCNAGTGLCDCPSTCKEADPDCDRSALVDCKCYKDDPTTNCLKAACVPYCVHINHSTTCPNCNFPTGGQCCAHPTNFHISGSGWESPDGVLNFEYVYDSSTGDKADFKYGTQWPEVTEYLTCPGGNPYSPPDPPFDSNWWVFTNPNRLPMDPDLDGDFTDAHGYWPHWHLTAGGKWTRTQVYQYRCFHCMSGWVDLMGPHGIEREVKDEGSGDWWYYVRKHGDEADLDLTP